MCHVPYSAVTPGIGAEPIPGATGQVSQVSRPGCGGTVDYLVDAVFNYPTLAESYKVAALDATNKMRAVTRLSN